MDKFTKKLTSLFESVEDKFREETIARYKRIAVAQYEHWVDTLRGEEPENRGIHGRMAKNDAMARPQYVRCLETKPNYMPKTWLSLREEINKGLYEVDFAKAEKDANDSVTYAKQHFIAKQSNKIANACQSRPDSEIKELVGTLACNGVVTGLLTVHCLGGDKFTIHMNMIVNHRFERGFTSFYQYPARFCDVYLRGATFKKASEKWMMENF